MVSRFGSALLYFAISATLASGVVAPDGASAFDSRHSTETVQTAEPIVETQKKDRLSRKQLKQSDLKELESEAIGEIDGVKLDKKTAKPEKKGFSIGDLNPLKWIFKPIIDVRQEVKTLGNQITRMQAPITRVQKPMVQLHQDLETVHGQIGELRTGMSGVHHKMADVDVSLAQVEKKLTKIYYPVVKLKEPVVAMSGPVKTVNSSIKSLTSDMKGLKETVTFTTTAILIAVLSIGLLIVVGTPIAGFVVWRNRKTIMKMIGGNSRDLQKLQREHAKLTS